MPSQPEEKPSSVQRVHQAAEADALPIVGNQPGKSVILQCRISDGFASWMQQASGALAITTPLSGQVTFLGWDGRQVTLLSRAFDKPMGVAVRVSRDALRSEPLTQLALATRRQVIVFANATQLAPHIQDGQSGSFDSLFLPRLTYHTGDINSHDLTFCGEDLWVVNTHFSCLATPSGRFSFVPRWNPPFISALAPEDRCHLNGLAIVDGKPKYVTCLGATDTAGGWRPDKATGGLLIDIESNQIILRGLCMPHSPRWHDGRLWLLNSGRGELCSVDPRTGKHVVVCALPAYTRGLSFVGHFALVGMSQIRQKYLYAGLPVEARHSKLISGLAVVDLRSGELAGMFEFAAGVSEVFEVAFLPGMRRPMIFNSAQEADQQAFACPDFCFMRRNGDDAAAAGAEPHRQTGPS
jgi:uncharacterized protein (TIGR03032 family)